MWCPVSSVHIYCTNLQACQSDYERERDREATREDIPAFSCFKKMCSNVSLVLVTLDSHTTQHTLGSLLLLQLLCYPYHYVVWCWKNLCIGIGTCLHAKEASFFRFHRWEKKNSKKGIKIYCCCCSVKTIINKALLFLKKKLEGFYAFFGSFLLHMHNLIMIMVRGLG